MSSDEPAFDRPFTQIYYAPMGADTLMRRGYIMAAIFIFFDIFVIVAYLVRSRVRAVDSDDVLRFTDNCEVLSTLNST